MGKANYLKKNKNSVFGLFMLFVAFLLLALLIPAIGAGPNAPAAWVSVVTFFESVRLHFSQYWMFYTCGGAVLFAYLSSTKK